MENAVTAIWRAAGMPTLKILRIMGQWIFRRLMRSFTQESVRMRVAITSAADTNWAKMVARATPSTPMWSLSTKNRSSTVLSTAHTTRK